MRGFQLILANILNSTYYRFSHLFDRANSLKGEAMNLNPNHSIEKIRDRKNSIIRSRSRRFNSKTKKLGLEPLEDRRLLSFGPALHLDGLDDYATAADNGSLDVGIGAETDFTLEARFNVPNANGEGRQVILDKEGAYSLDIDFHATLPDQITFQIWQGGTPYTVSATVSDLAVGWHHVAAVFDNQWSATQDQLAIYLDGVRVAAAHDTDFIPGIDDSSSALNVGARGGSDPFQGWIDEVRLSDVVRYNDVSLFGSRNGFCFRRQHPRIMAFR